jgi:hypothetical protein
MQGLEEANAEIERLKELLKRATKAMVCCTIIGWDKEKHEMPGFVYGLGYAVDAVNRNIWEDLGAPDGKRDYMWWERQIDPNVKFVNATTGDEIPYSSTESEAAT